MQLEPAAEGAPGLFIGVPIQASDRVIGTLRIEQVRDATASAYVRCIVLSVLEVAQDNSVPDARQGPIARDRRQRRIIAIRTA